MILSELAPLVSAQHGVFYSMTSPTDGGEPVLELQAGYGYEERKHLSTSFRLGEGLVGQCAKEKKRILLTDVPGDYVRINSGLGDAAPLNIIVLPVLFEGSVRAVVELASFSPFSVDPPGVPRLSSPRASASCSTRSRPTRSPRTCSSSRSRRPRSCAPSRRSCASRTRTSRARRSLLAEQNIEAEQKNHEVEQSKRLVEEKAGQLAVSSKYKSEFIANMSHELRTPLNSLLILAEQLEDNPDHNMTDTQVEYASVIHSLGQRAARAAQQHPRPGEGRVGHGRRPTTTTSRSSELRAALAARVRARRPDARASTTRSTSRPARPRRIVTDPQRLRQILKNLLANAFKFTERGQRARADRRWPTTAGTRSIESLDRGVRR